MKQLLIFDFDGVIADSEVLSNTVLAECVSAIGLPTTREESYVRYMGKRMPEIVAAIEAASGRRISDSFATDFEARVLGRFRRDLRLVAGLHDYVAAFPELRRCIASSSTPTRLALCMELLGLEALFGSNVFSAIEVARGKPAPDIFLHAAERMGVAAADCIVIEDSIGGVEAARAAGMSVIGLLAASHIDEGHGRKLLAAGAHFIARTFDDAQAITRALLAGATA